MKNVVLVRNVGYRLAAGSVRIYMTKLLPMWKNINNRNCRKLPRFAGAVFLLFFFADLVGLAGAAGGGGYTSGGQAGVSGENTAKIKKAILHLLIDIYINLCYLICKR